jgi:putative ABC transport system ATP-binding protein
MNKTLDVILQASGVTKVFGDGDNAVRAVDGVDLAVSEGEMVLIMGPSGSGKTTLLTMLGGLLRPTSGSIVIDGTEITTLSDGKLTPLRRKTVGFIFQSFNLWDALNVEENVELTLNMAGVDGHTAKERARKLLEDRGLGHRLKFRARDISGGEKQRVSIARALANEPRLLLADEPTANLDSHNGEALIHLMRDLRDQHGMTFVFSTHDPLVVAHATRIVRLRDGRVYADEANAPHEEAAGPFQSGTRDARVE